MSTQTFYTWVLPLCIGAVGGIYALWAARTYDRAMDKREAVARKTSAAE